MVYCHNCGKKSAKGIKFCPTCGASLKPKPETVAPKKSLGKYFRIIVILAILFVGAMILGAVYLVFTNGASQSTGKSVDYAWQVDYTKLIANPIAKNCTATLKSGECSYQKPFYCDDGKITRRSDICGCPENWRPNGTDCAYAFPCNDGTLSPDCSSKNKSYQCLNGTLIQNATLCGCPEDYRAQNDTCVIIPRCEDKTIYSECSTNKPLFCLDGNLIEKVSQCGCSEGYRINAESCMKIPKCSDGTLDGECSPTKPKFCSGTALVDMASQCGCPFGLDILDIQQVGDRCVDKRVEQIETQAHTLINEERAKAGLSPLLLDSALSDIARAHSEDMATNGYLAHVNLQRLDPTARAAARGYSCLKYYGSYYTNGIAENLYQGAYGRAYGNVHGCGVVNSSEDFAACAVDAWMGSPGHRANILTTTYDREGMGVGISGSRVYITEDFC